MKYVYQIFIFFMIVCQPLFSGAREQLNRLIYFPVKDELKLLSVIKHGFTRVSIVKDEWGNKYCVKQMKDNRRSECCDYRLIIESFCSYIAETIGAPINVVEIIPKDIEFVGKRKGRVASLHTFAHGKQVYKSGAFRHLNMRKHFIKLIHAAKHGLFSQKAKEGFMMSMIIDMSRHHQLPIIVALDTFIGNRDCGLTNLFYDQKSDQFCGIDMEKSFRKDLSQSLYQFFLGILDDLSVQLNNSELEALILYKNTLKTLLRKNKPKFLKELLDKIVIKSKIDLSSGVIFNQIKEYKKNIDKMYISANNLVKVLDKVI